jgi:anti-sigma regulatory factor (Ser/Thr protein kinase)
MMAGLRESPAEKSRQIYPSAPISARNARAFVASVLRGAQAGAAAMDDLGLIVSELVANAIQHGDGSDIVVCVHPDRSDGFNITVSSGVGANRPPMDPTTWTVAQSDQHSGRGLGMVRQLADEVTVELANDRLDVTCSRSR